MHQAVAGEVRVTVPIDGGSLLTDGFFVEGGRFEIAPEVELVVLREDERDRLMERDIFTDCRLEFFGLIAADWEYPSFDEEETRAAALIAEGDAAVRRVLQVLSLHALVSRRPWRPATMALDRFDGIHWNRIGHLEATAEWSQPQLGVSHFEVDRLPTWIALVREWPNDPAVNLALQYYAESVIERKDRRYTRSLVAAAIATEVLLGERTELSYRISVRGAHLVAVGERAIAVQHRLKRLYEARSALVHSGRQANLEVDCTVWQQFLMAALPRAAAYPGNLSDLRQDLDRANFVRSEHLVGLEADGWWSYCDFGSLVA